MNYNRGKSTKIGVLTIEEIRNRARKIALEQEVIDKNKEDWGLIKELKFEGKDIEKIYLNILNKLNTGKSIIQAEEWLIDNFYIIKDQMREIELDLPLEYHKKLPKLLSGEYAGHPRIYEMALKLVEFTDAKLQTENIISFIEGAQEGRFLKIGEVWAFPFMLRIALVQYVYGIAVELKKFNDDLKNDDKDAREDNGEFDQGQIKWKTEKNMAIGNAIVSLKMLGTLNWKELFEKLSIVEKILSKDSSKLYSKMDFESKDRYRHEIEEISNDLNVSEEEISKKLIEFSKKNNKDIGYFLIGSGREKFEKFINNKAKISTSKSMYRFLINNSKFLYFFSIFILTGLLTSMLLYYSYKMGSKNVWQIVGIGILTVIPISEIVLTGINYIITRLINPYIIPKLNFEKGIPNEFKTAVVVPCMFTNKKVIKELVEHIEVHYLANDDKNLKFALLGDLKDAKEERLVEDEELIQEAANQIKELNIKYGKNTFFLLNRCRKWNQKENLWMGWERKRGKLIEFNKLLRGDNNTNFKVLVGDLEELSGIKYVITLDADTKLPKNTARKLVGAIAHPLNRAVLNKEETKVIEGYGILQPRIAVAITSASRSFFSLIFSGQAGIDAYSSAISDIYQDLFREGIYTGKGIYDVDVFNKVLGESIPQNAVLSHDLLEGCYARTGLVTDIELVDGYPTKYNSYCARLYRWVRGDWQLFPWLFGKIKNSKGDVVKNPLGIVSKWKIFDNMRRSLVSPFLMLIMFLGLSVLPGRRLFWLLLVGIVLIFPIVNIVIDTAMSRPHGLNAKVKWINCYYDLKGLVSQTILSFTFLPYEAFLMLTAILKTSGRLFFTKRHMLEWQTSADAEKSLRVELKSFIRTMWIAELEASIILGTIVLMVPRATIVSMPFIFLWLVSPFIAYWVSKVSGEKRERISDEHIGDVRVIGRKTWRYFDEFVSKEDNYLAPDNYQAEPANGIAHRTSPTNIGLSLMANLCAVDLGYISIIKFLDKTEKIMHSIKELDKWKGHLYNWYDTKTMEPLKPLYVSAVDSGNFIVYLVTLKQGIVDLLNKQVININKAYGLVDTVKSLKVKNEIKLKILNNFIGENKEKFNLMLWNKLLHNIQIEKSTKEEEKWVDILDSMIEDFNKEIDEVLPWAEQVKNCEFLFGSGNESLTEFDIAIKNLIEELTSDISIKVLSEKLENIIYELDVEVEKLKNEHKQEEIENRLKWVKDFRISLTISKSYVKELNEKLEKLIQSIDNMIVNTDFKQLYDEDKQLFAIGYLKGKERLDLSSYDLLASEARQTSFIAIAKGDIEQKHWFRLSRAITSVDGYRALLSWTGTMFEYLMPLLIMKNFKNTLLNETYSSVVTHQMSYATKRNVPWGISESGFCAMDQNYNYQYKAFGAPGLGYKRGLNNDLVIAPYASVMALMVKPKDSIKNIKKLISMGMEGEYGLYEAIDFTKSRLGNGKMYEIVKSFMVHHQGMSLLSINNFINNNILQDRFHNEPMVKSVELLLQERVAKRNIITKQHEEEVECTYIRELEEEPVRRRFSVANTEVPEAHVLSNGKYTVMLTNTGSGYSMYDSKSISRWREDVTLDNWGMYIYIQNLNSMNFWSATYSPCKSQGDRYEVVYFPDRAVYTRTDGNIDTRTEVVVSPENNVEVRRVSITNHSEHERIIELTSYFEAVLTSSQSEISHPAFNNLFVRTEYIPENKALIASRRPRSLEETTMWVMHSVAVKGEVLGAIQYETDREKFIGRRRNVNYPVSMDINQPLSNTVGAVLDPCISLRVRVRIGSGETAHIAYSVGATYDRDEVIALAQLYSDYTVCDRAIEMAWTQSQVELGYLNMNSKQSNLMQKLLSSIIYMSPLKKINKDIISRNVKGQSALWAYGISGDIPVVLVKIKSIEKIGCVKQLLDAHAYWKLKGISVDLVILNEDDSGYTQPLRDRINEMIMACRSNGLQGQKGGIFQVQSENLNNEDRVLLITVARLVFDADNGGVNATLNAEIEEKKLPDIMPELEGEKIGESIEQLNKVYGDNKVSLSSAIIKSKLEFFNGYGGFNNSNGEYVMILDKNKNTPMPWINVISNESFGFQVSESGVGYTWAKNSRENKLTVWSNDPVCDQPMESVYLRDEESAKTWTISKAPIVENGDYIIRHGQGYSIFEHTSGDIYAEKTVFVSMKHSVKMCMIRLKNLSNKESRISATYYAELVLGVNKASTMGHIVTWNDEENNMVTAKNAYNEDFSKGIAYMKPVFDEGEFSFTCNRTEFLGRNGSYEAPKGLRRIGFSGDCGAGLDACIAEQVKVVIQPKSETTIAFLFGEEESEEKILNVINEFSDIGAISKELELVKKYWMKKLGALKVSTPDESFNLINNSWLLYQTLSCRIWARSAFYQSGGAYGFRDQLQDVMSLLITYPKIAKEQILRACSHQFLEGDVQHWWHTGKDKGIRTKFSDDLLWLPYVTSEYINITGDYSILDEEANYIEDTELGDGEDERYNTPKFSDIRGSVYEHCIKAIHRSLKFGEHGMPLMGSGDWNDGMSTVGREGKGESVWLAWFMFSVLEKFIPICKTKDDSKNILNYEKIMNDIKIAVEKHGWDGGWYRRAYFDDGTPLGSRENEECQIDALAQSWAVLSGAGDKNRIKDAMTAVENYLVKKDEGLIRLLTPPFDKSKLEPGYIKSYIPGVRENGGQYTHAAVWTVAAFAKMGLGDKAYEFYNMINPINHSRNDQEAIKYKVEPYVMVADVYSSNQYAGKGGWSWYTGAAGWMYRVGIEYILGFIKTGEKLMINPCIPKEWREYSIEYKYGNSLYKILVKNPQGVNSGIEEFLLDGKTIKEKEIVLNDDGKDHIIEIKIGRQTVALNSERIG